MDLSANQILKLATAYAQRNRLSAEDAQDFALEIATNLFVKYGHRSIPQHLISAACRNLFISYHRKKAIRVSLLNEELETLLLEDHHSENDPVKALAANEFANEIVLAMARLTGNQRICFEEHHLHENSIESIAAKLDISRGAVEQN